MKKIKLPPPLNPMGYTQTELRDYIPKKRRKAFNKAFGVQTCGVDKYGRSLYYTWDVERALAGLPPLD